VPRDPVDPTRPGAAGHLEVAAPAQLAVLVLGEDVAQHLLGALLSLTPVRPSPAAQRLMGQHPVRSAAQQANDQQDEEELERDDGDDHGLGAPSAARDPRNHDDLFGRPIERVDLLGRLV
jgi:hypothetical protein